MRKLLLLCLCLLFLSHTAADDFGDFSGGSDYGGGWDSGYSSSGGGYSSSGGGGWSGGYGGSSSDSGVGALIALGAMIAIFLIMGAISSSATNQEDQQESTGQSGNPPGAEPTDPSSLRPISDYPSIDPYFSEEAFKKRLSEIYVRLQHAWQAKDLEPVRQYLTGTQFSQYDLQLNNYRNNKRTNVMENIAVLDIAISGWKREGNEDVIIARLKSRLIDYVIDDATGQIVRGSRTAEKYMEYEYAMSRRSGVKTPASERTRTVTCPNCGFAVVINQSAVCPYCNSHIQASAIDWTVSGIKGLSQRTVEK